MTERDKRYTFINNTDIQKIYETLPKKEHKFHYEKYENMRYSFDDIKVFCAAHIIRSLYKNEQRAIQFEKNVNFVLEQETNNPKGTSFLELLILENTSIIRKTLDVVKIKIKKDKKTNTRTKTDNLDTISDYADFIENTNSWNTIETARNTLPLKEILLRKKGKEDTNSIEQEAKAIIQNMASVVGYETSNGGGGLLLYKYQNIENNNNHIVIANVGDTSLSNLYANMPIRCLASDILEGKNYLMEGTKTENNYTWTNFTISYNNKKKQWLGQNDDDKDYTNDSDILNGINTKNIKRILFIRISNFNEEKELKGDAVFVFYDNQPKDKYNSIHTIRFIHSLRNEINEYFEKRYRNDSFRNWVESEKFLNAPDHNYYNILSELNHYRNDNDKYNFLHSMLMVKKEIHEILKTKSIESIKTNIKPLNVKEQIDFCVSMMFTEDNKPIVNGNDNISINFYEPLFRHIMYEYIRNARKAAKPTDININININISNNNNECKILIQNKHDCDVDEKKSSAQKEQLRKYGYSDSSKIKGLYLNALLLKAIDCGFPSVEIELENYKTIFTVSLTLKNL